MQISRVSTQMKSYLCILLEDNCYEIRQCIFKKIMYINMRTFLFAWIVVLKKISEDELFFGSLRVLCHILLITYYYYYVINAQLNWCTLVARLSQQTGPKREIVYIFALTIKLTLIKNYRSPNTAIQLLNLYVGYTPYLTDAPLSHPSYFFCEVKIRC